MKNYKIIELTKDNKLKYLDQIAELEIMVLENMQKQGKIGQLFITGKNDVEQYVDSDDNTVIIAVNDQEEVVSAAYITQGQKMFTYNDITKYFKYGEKYNSYIKENYSCELEYKKDMLDAYKLKLDAYKYSKDKVLNENENYKNIMEFLTSELLDSENQFHEKSVLRESLNTHMSTYVKNLGNKKLFNLYEQFYWITSEKIINEFGKNPNDYINKHLDVFEYDAFINSNKPENNNLIKFNNLMFSEESLEHNIILEKGALKIYEEPEFELKEYYNANTENSIEIDTYITDPRQRNSGLARILVFEGIKNHINKYFMEKSGEQIFLCSTLHRENLSSKYVSEFFGLKDSLFVKRRQGRDREVHICKIERQEAEKYINKMENKLAVLYDYNPRNKTILNSERREIFEEQLKIELDEINRIDKIKQNSENYKGNINVCSKSKKIDLLMLKLEEVKKSEINVTKKIKKDIDYEK
ncbi:MAG TPA: hypothetical protein PK993_03850 [Clostridia bacterium]|nr:hypothetical protein [Clostridia bacterium]